MKLAKIKDQHSLAYMERYVNWGSRTYSQFSADTEIDPRYQPFSEEESFELPTVLIPQHEITLFLDHPNEAIKNKYIQGDKVIFPIHPEVFNDLTIRNVEKLHQYPEGPKLRVAPSSSTRTVYVFDDEHPHFIKLHVPKRISRFLRRLRRRVIQTEVAISSDVAQISVGKFGFLPETIGGVFGEDREDWGFIIRELPPRPVISEQRYLIPQFALFSQDYLFQEDDPLLVQLIRYLEVDPKEFILEKLMKPHLKSWAEAVKQRGIIFGAHGQNSLLELDKNFNPTRIIHRDFDLRIDPTIREKNGLETPFTDNLLGGDYSGPKEYEYSLIYDRFIGHHLFDYLAKLMSDYFQVSETELQQICKEAIHLYFPDMSDYLPESTYYFSDELLPNNEHKLVDTGEKPKWR